MSFQTDKKGVFENGSSMQIAGIKMTEAAAQ